MGSVKDLTVVVPASERSMGIGRFRFSDRYSVFDWGEMPDAIPGKGAALCMIGAYVFEQAEESGLGTHYRGILLPDGTRVDTDGARDPVDTMEVYLVRVLRPTRKDGAFDYSAYADGVFNALVPLEIIYRNAVTEGSSLLKRLARGEARPQDFGLDRAPVPGERFAEPLLDVSTKLEPTDRYLTWEAAARISGLEQEEVDEIQSILRAANACITGIAGRAGLENVDGKIEVGCNDFGDMMLVDVAGTPDECRFLRNGVHVSKELARTFYRKTEWYQAVERAKAEAKQARDPDWKKFCSLQPPELDSRLRTILSNMYQSTANGMLGRNIFDSPPLDQVIAEYKTWEAAAA